MNPVSPLILCVFGPPRDKEEAVSHAEKTETRPYAAAVDLNGDPLDQQLHRNHRMAVNPHSQMI